MVQSPEGVAEMKPDSRSAPGNSTVEIGGGAVNFMIPILLELAASDEGCPWVTLPRQPVEELIEDWLRLADELNSLLGPLPSARPMPQR